MAVTATIKYTQGVNVGVAGRALEGVVGQSVTVANDTETNVTGHTYTILSVPAGSGLSLGVIGTGATASFTPDVSGCYRVRVTVTDGSQTSSMVRVFGVANSRNWLIPAFDGDAAEHNFSGQLRGWAATTTVKMLDYILTDIAENAFDKLTAPTIPEAGYLARATNDEDLEYIAGSQTGQVAMWTGTTVAFGAVDLANANAVTGRLPFTNLPQVSTSVVLGRYGAGTGDIQQLTLDTTLTMSVGGQLGRAAISGDITIAANSNTAAITGNVIVDADIYTGAAISYSKLADAPGTSVLARAAGSTGPLAALAASVNNQVLRRDATGTLAFGPVDLTDTTNAVTGQLPLSAVANLAGLSFLGRAGTSTGVMAAITGTAGQVARVATDGSSLGFGTIDLSLAATVGTSKLALGNVVDLSALSVLGRAGNTSGTMAAITAANDFEILMRSGASLVFATISASNFTNGSIPLTKLANIATDTLLGRDTAGTGSVEVITLNATLSMTGSGALQRAAITGDVTIAAGSNTAAITGNSIIDADVNTNAAIAYSKLAAIAGLSVVGNATNVSAVAAAITGTADQVLRVSGTTLGFGLIVDANVTPGTLTLGKLASGAAASILGRAAATGGTYADITSSANGQVVTRSGGVVVWGAVDLADGTNAVANRLAFSNIATLAGNSLLGRAAATVGQMAAITATVSGNVAMFDGTSILFSAIDLSNAGSVTGTLPLASLPSLAGLSVLGNAAAGTGVMAAITGTADQVLRVNTAGTALGFGTIQTAGIGNNQVTLAKLATQAALSVLANATNAVAVPSAVAAASDGLVFLRSGTTLVFGQVQSAGIADTAVLYAKIQDVAGSSVIGRSAATPGVSAAITAAANQVLRADGSAVLAFGAIDLSQAATVGTSKLPVANMADMAGLSVLGRGGSTTGPMAAITGTAGLALVVNSGGTALAFGQVDTAGIVNNAITLAKLATQAALTVIANATNAVAVPTAVAAGSDFQIFRRSGTALAFGSIDLSQSNAVGTSKLGYANFVDGSATSVVGRSAGTSGVQASIAATVNNQVLRRDASGVLGFGPVNLGDTTNAVTGSLPQGSIAPSGTVGRMLTTIAGPLAAWSTSFGNGVESFAFDTGGYDFAVGGTSRINVTSTSITLGNAPLQWTGSIVNASLGINSIATAGPVTGTTLTIHGQDTTGSIAGGAVVAGTTRVRAGNSTNGTGGVLDLRSGTGAVSAGDLTLRLGSTIVAAFQPTQISFGLGGTNELTISATTIDALNNNIITTGTLSVGNGPATLGHVRIANGAGSSDGVQFRNGANSANVLGLALSSGNTLVLGDAATNGYTISSAGVHTWKIGSGSDALTLASTFMELGTGVVRLRFSNASVSPVIQVEAGTSGTGTSLELAGMDMTSASAVGGITYVRGGNATNTSGQGGELQLLSGTGATAAQAGLLTMKFGSVTVYQAASTGITHDTATSTYHRFRINSVELFSVASDRLHVGNGGLTSGNVGAANYPFFTWISSGTAQCNIGLLTAGSLTPNYNSGSNVLFIGKNTTVPSANPTNGIYAWVRDNASDGKFGLVTRSDDGVMRLGNAGVTNLTLSSIAMTHTATTSITLTSGGTLSAGGQSISLSAISTSISGDIDATYALAELGSATGNTLFNRFSGDPGPAQGMIFLAETTTFPDATTTYSSALDLGAAIGVSNGSVSLWTTKPGSSGALGQWDLNVREVINYKFTTAFNLTSGSTAAGQVIGQVNTDFWPNDCSGMARVVVFVNDTASPFTKRGSTGTYISFKRVGGTLTYMTSTSFGGVSDVAGAGLAAGGQSGDTLYTVIQPVTTTNRTYVCYWEVFLY